jgi:predicted RNA-binding Zn-ribbon protein involved in translation (DUF1610 family)
MCDGDEFEFTCPACGETLAVNGSMKTALIRNGCVVCGAVLSKDAFTRK